MAQKRLKSSGIKTLKTLHLILVMMWVIGVVAMTIIYFVPTHSGDELYMSFKLMRVIDDFIVVPGAILTVVTAIVYGAYTNWGFFKHRWITVKWIVSIVVIIVGTFVLSPWLDTCLEVSDKLRDGAMTNLEVVRKAEWIFISAIIQSAALIFLVVISVFKPWKGRKRVPSGTPK